MIYPPSIGAALVDALGLHDFRISSIDLHFAVNEVPMAEVKMIVMDKSVLDAVEEVIRRYHLNPTAVESSDT